MKVAKPLQKLISSSFLCCYSLLHFSYSSCNWKLFCSITVYNKNFFYSFPSNTRKVAYSSLFLIFPFPFLFRINSLIFNFSFIINNYSYSCYQNSLYHYCCCSFSDLILVVYVGFKRLFIQHSAFSNIQFKWHWKTSRYSWSMQDCKIGSSERNEEVFMIFAISSLHSSSISNYEFSNYVWYHSITNKKLHESLWAIFFHVDESSQ